MTTDDAPNNRPSARFSLRSLLLLTAACAVALGFYLQQRRLDATRAALARYESSQVDTSLAPGEFRVIVREVFSSSHVKIVEYLIESNEEHYATVASGGDSGSSSSRFNDRAGVHTNRVTLLLDSVSLKDVSGLRMMVNVGGAGGHSFTPKPDGYTLDGAFKPLTEGGVFPIGDGVELFEADGRVYSLKLK